MARSRSTSKKPSAASSSQRRLPESLVFFIDRSLGRKKVPEALRAAGPDVRVHDELFPQGTQDVVWLGEAGANRWVVITRDDRIRYNQLEKQAVLAAKLRFFSITSSSLTGDEAASLILSAVSAMTRLCRQDIEDIRRHAETMACIVVEMYQEQCRDSGQLEELDVEGILAFAERVLPRASDLRVRASLDQRQRFQQLFFPDGISFDGKGFVRPA